MSQQSTGNSLYPTKVGVKVCCIGYVVVAIVVRLVYDLAVQFFFERPYANKVLGNQYIKLIDKPVTFVEEWESVY